MDRTKLVPSFQRIHSGGTQGSTTTQQVTILIMELLLVFMLGLKWCHGVGTVLGREQLKYLACESSGTGDVGRSYNVCDLITSDETLASGGQENTLALM